MDETGAARDAAADTSQAASRGGLRDARDDASQATAAARERLGRAQAVLLASLVADSPVPDGFDADRLAVQRRALLGKRADVIAKVAPELPQILGGKTFRSAFFDYARTRPMTGGHRRDALEFVRHLLQTGEAGADARGTRRKLRVWWLERAGPAPLPEGRLRRLLHLLLAR